MKRNSIIIPELLINLSTAIYPEILTSDIEVRLDKENAGEILSFLLLTKGDGSYLHLKKFARILREIYLGKYNEDLYAREKVSKKAENVTAMKFKGAKNIRIGCKEIFCGSKKVIMVTCFHKKTQKNSKKEIVIYETIGGYEYGC